MTTHNLSSRTTVHPAVPHQERYDTRRRLLARYVLRPIVFGLLVKVHVEGREHIPAQGPLIVVMNHVSGIDPFVVVGAMRTRDLVPMSKMENYTHPIVGLMARLWGAFPVRRGEVDRRALASALAVLAQQRALLLAPEGTRRPALSEAKEGVAYLAVRADAPILPVGLDGTDRFPADWGRLRRPQVSLRFGRPFRLRTGGERVGRDAMQHMTREIMYQIAGLVPEERRGIYADLSRTTTETLEFLH